MLTVATTHFSDYTAVTRFQLRPQSAVVRVGQSVELVVNSCGRRDFIDKLFKLSGPCLPVSTAVAAIDWTVNDTSENSYWGTITDSVKDAQTGGTYTAPAKKPKPNVVTVRANVGYKFYKTTPDVWVFALITIVDGGYRASGQMNGTVFSGVICDLEKPFTVTVTVTAPPMPDYVWKFVPSSPTSGTASLTYSYKVLTANGSGTYTVEGVDSGKPWIVLNAGGTGRIPTGSGSGGGLARIDLTPLEGNECADK